MKDKKKGNGWKSLAGAILRVATAVVLAAGLLVLFRSVVNHIFRINYEAGNYAEFPEQLLTPLRLGDDYVVPYNMGNLAFLRGDYPTAEARYRSALSRRPPAEEKECAIRINLALAMLHGYSFDTLDRQDEAAVKEALELLYAARRVLTESGCAEEAADSWDGHSPEAEKLKRDIDEMIRSLQPPEGGGQSEEELPQDDQENPDEDHRDEDNPEEENQDSSGDDQTDEGSPEQEQARQEELNDQLKEQKRELEEGSYEEGSYGALEYRDLGDNYGYGEGASW